MASATNSLLQMALAGLQARAGGVPPGGAPAAAAAPGMGAPNPMMALLGGAAGPAVGGPGAAQGAPGGPDVGNDVSAMLANNRGADLAGMLVQQLRNMARVMSVWTVHTMEPIPQVASELAKMIPQINRVIGHAEKAQNVNAAVRGAQQSRQPIMMGAAQPTPQSLPAQTPMGMAA